MDESNIAIAISDENQQDMLPEAYCAEQSVDGIIEGFSQQDPEIGRAHV